MRGLFVTGTDTGVGKTVLAAAVLAALRADGHRVAAFKPVVTGLDEPPAAGWAHDHELLGAAAASAPEVVSPWRFGPPVSPHLAAKLADTRVTLTEMAGAARELGSSADVLVVEGVGGLLVPLTAEHSVRDLARELELGVLVAARPGLGTINHTLLTLEAARSASLRVVAVVLTPWGPEPMAVELSNRDTIARLGRVEVAGLARAADSTTAALTTVGAQLPLDRWLEL